ncbi:MAG: beta-glucosidase [Blastocatellia bacterium]|jgi:beta-glucosidase|nr:beta-glucosidase [Blastocatellia bacterium]
MPLSRSNLSQLTSPQSFLWATGIEDTFIIDPWPGTGRTLDEYELTQHYTHWKTDLKLISEIGVKTIRYGLPWHRINPARDKWDWGWTDGVLERLLEYGIDPIIDLVHYGTPAWIEGAFLNPDFPERMAEYAARVAERFKGRIRAFTPLNEPRITAWYCGKLGWWPPYRRGWGGFVSIMKALCAGIVRTQENLLAVDNQIVTVHVDATDLFTTKDDSLRAEVDLRQQLVFLGLDLITGLVTPLHPLYSFVLKHGMSESELTWFSEHAVKLDVLGINMYPMYTLKEMIRTTGGIRTRMPYASADLVEQLATMYWQRYHRPIMIAETASVGPVKRRLRWLNDSLGAVRRLRAGGVPLIGYTWWPMFALIGWAYRQNNRPFENYLLQMGLWDLQSDNGNQLERVATPIVDIYKEMIAGGIRDVGKLALAGA